MNRLMKAFALLIAVGMVLSACQTDKSGSDITPSVLVFSKTTDFRHNSIPKGIETLTALGARGGFNVVASEDAALFTDDALRGFHAVIFLNTTGDILNSEQQNAFERYIQAGGGFVGIHAAADTEWKNEGWGWYQRLVGGVFQSHPSNSDQPATVRATGEPHPSVASLPTQWQASDEWYDYQRLSKGINVLLEVDESTYEGGKMGAKHPITWYREFDGGRSFYTGLGHTDAAYDSPKFQELLLGGIQWAMGSGKLDYSKSKPEMWRFSHRILDSGLNEPLKIAFSPQGELYFIERAGAIKRFDFEKNKTITVAKLSVFTAQEYGLLGLAFDPDFPHNQWLYLYRTLPHGETARLVLSRFKLRGDALDLDSEQELLSMPGDGNARIRTTHTGGDMQFDAKGNLWLTTGDDTEADNHGRIDDRPGFEYHDAARTAANTNDLRGKILRIRPREEADQSGRLYDIPEGNLFEDPAHGRPEIYIMGLRNPYTLAVDDRTGTVYWGEVGPDGREDDARGPRGYDEINRSTKPGNFGWPYVIGDNFAYHYYDKANEKVLDEVSVTAPENRSRNNTGAKVLPPAQPAWIYYPYAMSDRFFELESGGRNALVAKPYYSADYGDSDIKFPAWLDGKLIIGEFMRRWLQVVNLDQKGEIESITPLIDHRFSAPLDMAFGPDGALYVLEYGTTWFQGNPDAYLSRVEYYRGDNPAPVAVASADKMVGAIPLVTVLDGSESFDRGASSESLKYRWERIVDGRAVEQLGSQPQQPVSLETAGENLVRLTVTDEGGSSHATELRFVVGNAPPEVRIDIDGNRSFYRSGINPGYHVSVSDLEDGDTKSGSITAERVSVNFAYVRDKEELEQKLTQFGVDPLLKGRELVTRGSDCHACHREKEESIGPSLRAIGGRYAKRNDAVEYLSTVIGKGVSGQWGGSHAMPAHPDLDDSQLRAAAEYILSLAKARTGGAGLGLSGAIKFNSHQQDALTVSIDSIVKVDLGTHHPGKYLLHAAYTDNGAGGAVPPLRSSASVVLRDTTQYASFFDGGVGYTYTKLSDRLSLAMISAPEERGVFAHAVARQIDLSGIKELRVKALGVKGMMAGGELQLRLGDSDKVIGKGSVNLQAVPEAIEPTVIFDLSNIDGVHDLRLGSEVTDENAGKLLFAIALLEFVFDDY